MVKLTVALSGCCLQCHCQFSHMHQYCQINLTVQILQAHLQRHVACVQVLHNPSRVVTHYICRKHHCSQCTLPWYALSGCGNDWSQLTWHTCVLPGGLFSSELRPVFAHQNVPKKLVFCAKATSAQERNSLAEMHGCTAMPTATHLKSC